MKKSLILIALFACCCAQAYAGFSLGRPAAIKRHVSSLDIEVARKKASAAAAVNHSPILNSFLVVSTRVVQGGMVQVSFDGSDPDGDVLSYVWTSTSGAFTGSGAVVKWMAPGVDGVYTISCTVSDGRGASVVVSTDIAVVPPGTVKWVYSIGSAVNSSPAIGDDGTVYVTAADGKLYALDPDNGSIKWTFATNALVPIDSSPAISSNSVVYFGDGNGDFYAVSASSHASLPGWPVNIGTYIESSPAIGPDGTVYIGSDNGGLYALDSVTGLPKAGFSFTNPSGAINSSPAIAPDGTIYVGSEDGLYALDPVDGSVKTGFPYLTSGAVYSSPAIGADGVVYFGSKDSNFYAVDPADGTLKWAAPLTVSDEINTSPAISPDGSIIYFGDDAVQALDGARPAGSWPMSMTSKTSLSSPAVGADGTVFVGFEDSTFYALDPSGPSVRWAVPVAAPVYSSPNISSDCSIYFASSDGSIYGVFNNVCLATSSWPKFRKTIGNAGY